DGHFYRRFHRRHFHRRDFDRGCFDRWHFRGRHFGRHFYRRAFDRRRLDRRHFHGGYFDRRHFHGGYFDRRHFHGRDFDRRFYRRCLDGGDFDRRFNAGRRRLFAAAAVRRFPTGSPAFLRRLLRFLRGPSAGFLSFERRFGVRAGGEQKRGEQGEDERAQTEATVFPRGLEHPSSWHVMSNNKEPFAQWLGIPRESGIETGICAPPIFGAIFRAGQAGPAARYPPN